MEPKRLYEERGFSTMRPDLWEAFLAGWQAAEERKEPKTVPPQREGDYL